MKKFIQLLLLVVMCLSIASCGKKDSGSGSESGSGSGEGTGSAELDKELASTWASAAKGKTCYLTTVGQSDIDLVKSILNKVGATVVDQYAWSKEQTTAPASCTATTHIGYNDTLTAADCDANSVVFLVTGTSNKGLGTAGVSVQSETTRATGFANAANAGSITLIVLHIGGADRRGTLTDPILDVVCPKANLMLVVNDGNSDNYFTNSAAASGKELYLYSTKAKVANAFKTLFN